MIDNTINVEDLVKPDRIHRRLYEDPAIFELEMKRIWGRAWLYVGHESQVPEKGDYVAAELGGQPVVMVRHSGDGEVRVLFNRCGHRGALVCNETCGNVRHFRCCYHGWTFKTNGELLSVPLKSGYGDDFDMKDPQFGMMPVPRVETYRGFVFASLSETGPDLQTHLGPMKGAIDDVINLAPEGEIIVTGGAHRYMYEGNWKAQADNLNDLYHPPYSHESTTKEGRQFQRQGSNTGAQFVDDEGNPISFWDETGIRAFPNGHGYCGKLPDVSRGTGPGGEAYLKALEERHGSEGAREILDVTWHNAIFYPNLCIQSAAQHIRVIRPISVNRTEVTVYPILLKGAPEEYNQQIIRYLNITHAAASLIQTDDLEAFRRISVGLRTQGAEWVMLLRYFGKDKELPDGSGQQGLGTSELELRNQYKAWLDYMNLV
jgi:phenylpropionate dioxygenase-like ring-hydroxylating dioxygenase large terminal subunit